MKRPVAAHEPERIGVGGQQPPAGEEPGEGPQPRNKAAHPIPGGAVRHVQGRSNRPHTTTRPHHRADDLADHLHHIEAAHQAKRRNKGVANPTRHAPRPPHPQLQTGPTTAHRTLITRPEQHRDPTPHTNRTRDLNSRPSATYSSTDNKQRHTMAIGGNTALGPFRPQRPTDGGAHSRTGTPHPHRPRSTPPIRPSPMSTPETATYLTTNSGRQHPATSARSNATSASSSTIRC